jgi:hypothetical protein
MANKKFWFVTLAVILALGLVLGGCDTEAENPDENQPADISKDITVYMEKPSDWYELYAYVWDDAGNEYTASSPGTLLNSAGNGYYSFRTNKAEYGYINVRFSNGGSQSSIDILGVDANTYYKSSGVYLEDTSKVKSIVTIRRCGKYTCSKVHGK